MPGGFGIVRSPSPITSLTSFSHSGHDTTVSTVGRRTLNRYEHPGHSIVSMGAGLTA